MITLNYKKVFETLVEETKKYLLDNNLKAMVLGISGGIDSTVTAAICHEVSKQTGIPLIGRSLPIKNKAAEFDTSELVGEAFCSDFQVVELKDLYETTVSMIVYNEQASLDDDIPTQTPIANGNIQARLRMTYLYNLASIYGGLVMSTDNQTEYQLGFWTIHGDVGDFDPLQGLWKTEVYGLANWLLTRYAVFNEVDKGVAIGKSMELVPTDGLGISNSDLDQIGAKSYEEVDAILQDFLVFAEDYKDKREAMKDYFGYNALYETDPSVIEKVLQRHIASEFKRKQSPIYIERSKYEI